MQQLTSNLAMYKEDKINIIFMKARKIARTTTTTPTTSNCKQKSYKSKLNRSNNQQVLFVLHIHSTIH